MKLGVNAVFLNDTPTGIGVYTKEVSAGLCALNEETTVFTSASWGSLDDHFIKKTPVAARGSLRLSGNLLRFLYTNIGLPVLARNCGTEVLYCPIAEFPFIPLSPMVVTVHDLHPLHFPRQFGLAADHFRFSMRLLPRVARRVVVPSAFVKKELLELTRLEEGIIDVVPNGYNPSLFKPQDSGMKEDFLTCHRIRGPFILFVGSLFPYKNIKGLIKAFLEIKDRIPHSLVIVGKRELSPEPPDEDLRIIYTGYVPGDDVPKFYSFADVAVNPSLAEGFGMTVLEAMACGTPVISSNRGSLPEITGDAGIIFDPDNSGSLADSILAVITNRGLQRELVEKGFRHVRSFSWEKTAEGVLRSCERALGKKA